MACFWLVTIGPRLEPEWSLPDFHSSITPLKDFGIYLPLTFDKRGLEALAAGLARRVAAARMADARSIEYPSRFAMDFATFWNPL